MEAVEKEYSTELWTGSNTKIGSSNLKSIYSIISMVLINLKLEKLLVLLVIYLKMGSVSSF